MKKSFTLITRWLTCALVSLSLLPLSVNAQCNPVGETDLPLTLNFNDAALPPECWSTDGQVNLSSTAYGGSGFAINFMVSSDAGAYLISPIISGDISKLAVSFRAYGVAGRKLSVGALLTQGDLSSLEQVGVAELSADDTWTDFYIPVGADFEGTSNVSLVVYAGSGDDATPIYLDDLAIEVQSACPRARNITLQDYSADAVFTWDANENATAWNVVVRLNGTEAFNEQVNEPVARVGGLASSTEYNFEIEVTALCDGESASTTTATGNFKTACGALPLPFSEDFEDLTTLPECWTFFTTSQNYAKFRVRTTANVDVNGKGLDFQNSRGKNIMHAILPPLAGQDVSNYTATFRYSQDRKTGKLQFGYLTNASDTATFISLTGELPQSGSYLPTSLYLAEVPLADVPAAAQALAWRFYAPGEDINAAIDDIRIEANPDCGKPAGISVSALTSAGATLLINDPDASHFQWEVAAILGTDSIKQITGQRSVTISGLAAATTYSLAVRTLCQDGKSPWVAGDNFTTGCLPQGNAETGFSENFDSFKNVAEMICWTFSDPSKAVIFRGDDEEEAEYVSDYVESKRSLALVYSQTYAIVPELAFPLSNSIVKFWLYLADDNLRVGHADPANVDGTFVEVKLIEPQVGEVTVSFEGVEVPEGHRLVLYYNAAERGDWSPCAFDNLSIMPSSGCSTPSDLIVSRVESTSADINWYGEAPSHKVLVFEGNVQYSALGTATPKQELDIDGQLNATITGLKPETLYSVAVRGVCDGSVSFFSDIVTFTTECEELQLPYTDSFENGATRLNCWNILSGTATTTDKYASDGKRSLYITSGDVILASPKLAKRLSDCKLSFDARSLYGATIYVGVMSNPSDASTLFNLTSIDIPEITGVGFPTFSLYFKDILADSELESYADSHYFALTIASPSAYGYVYIDKLIVEEADDCLPATDLQLTNVDDQSATMIWTSNGAKTATVELYTAPYTNGATPAISQSVETRGATIHGLAPTTTYYAYVVNDCEGGEKAPRSPALVFTTTAIARAVPFKYGFEDGEGDAFTFITNPGNKNNWTVGNAAEAVHSGSKALYITNGNGFEYTIGDYSNYASSAAWAYTTLKFDNAGTYEVSYAWRNNGESEDFLSIFLAPATTKLAIGESYYGNSYYGTIGGQGVFNSSTPSVAGLKVLDHGVYGSEEWYETTREIEITEAGAYILAFLWNNDEYNGEQHPAAIDDIQVKLKDETSLASVRGTVISLNPSVISKGEQVCVNYDFTAAQRDNMTIEIIDMAGRKVADFHPNQDIKIGGFNAAGMYLVRIKAGNGDTFTGRVLVK
ncbi:MAG: fibronectin type III domain-containing protein [Paludibacteraceae bacterium]|nr:fibronectin type III domain-containing protein [Paludibacteraceae bacterium]